MDPFTNVSNGTSRKLPPTPKSPATSPTTVPEIKMISDSMGGGHKARVSRAFAAS